MEKGASEFWAGGARRGTLLGLSSFPCGVRPKENTCARSPFACLPGPSEDADAG